MHIQMFLFSAPIILIIKSLVLEAVEETLRMQETMFWWAYNICEMTVMYRTQLFQFAVSRLALQDTFEEVWSVQRALTLLVGSHDL